jgi:hypothetical protein
MFTQEDLVYAYTRAQAVEDGEQVLLTDELAQLAREAGWNYPIYITRSVWFLIEMAVANKKHHNDLKGVLWDVLNMAGFYARANRSGNEIRFKVIITGASRKRNHVMVAQVGPTDIDNPSPAVTIMFPEEM